MKVLQDIADLLLKADPTPYPQGDAFEADVAARVACLVARVSVLEELVQQAQKERDEAIRASRLGRLPFRIPDSQPAPQRVVVGFEATGKGRFRTVLECGHRYGRKREHIGGLRECRKCARGLPADAPRSQVEPVRVGGVL